MAQFYAPNITETLTLPEAESGHAVRVLRLSEGDEIEVVDGKGWRHQCRITLAHHKHCAVEIVTSEHSEPHWGHRIVLAIAPTKNLDRMEWMAEKCTEMGVDEIIPLLCRYSERKELKTERLQKILVSAMKQSLKTTVPVLREMTPIKQIIAEPFDGDRYIAYCDKSIPRQLLASLYTPGRNVMLMIGPEGDFSREEIELALQAGFRPVSLGESRLRTETAAVFGCATFHALNQAHPSHK